MFVFIIRDDDKIIKAGEHVYVWKFVLNLSVIEWHAFEAVETIWFNKNG